MNYLVTSRRPGVWFQLHTLIGQGGYANVYRCFAISYVLTQRISPLAIKFLREAGDPEIFRRFVVEARLLGSIRHPNLVPAVEINLAHNPPYYAMPLMKESLF